MIERVFSELLSIALLEPCFSYLRAELFLFVYCIQITLHTVKKFYLY